GRAHALLDRLGELAQVDVAGRDLGPCIGDAHQRTFQIRIGEPGALEHCARRGAGDSLLELVAVHRWWSYGGREADTKKPRIRGGGRGRFGGGLPQPGGPHPAEIRIRPSSRPTTSSSRPVPPTSRGPASIRRSSRPRDAPPITPTGAPAAATGAKRVARS